MEFEKLKNIIAEVLNVDPDEITMDTTFMDDLGADSLDVFQIIMGLEEAFDIEIPSEKAEKSAAGAPAGRYDCPSGADLFGQCPGRYRRPAAFAARPFSPSESILPIFPRCKAARAKASSYAIPVFCST